MGLIQTSQFVADEAYWLMRLTVVEGHLRSLGAEKRASEGSVELTTFGTSTEQALGCCAVATEE